MLFLLLGTSLTLVYLANLFLVFIISLFLSGECLGSTLSLSNNYSGNTVPFGANHTVVAFVFLIPHSG